MLNIENHFKELSTSFEKVKKKSDSENLELYRLQYDNFGDSHWIFIPKGFVEEGCALSNNAVEYIVENFIKKEITDSERTFSIKRDLEDGSMKVEVVNSPNYGERFNIKNLNNLAEKGYVQVRKDTFHTH